MRRALVTIITAVTLASAVGINTRMTHAMTDCWNRLGPQIDILAQRHQAPQTLILAVVYHESGCRENAVRFEPHAYNWPQVVQRAARETDPEAREIERRFLASSWGVAQVLGITARGMGYDGAPGEFKHRSLEYGIRYLGLKLRQYGNWDDALAAYNGGHGAVLRKRRSGTYGPRVELYVRSVKVLRARYAQPIVKAWLKALRETLAYPAGRVSAYSAENVRALRTAWEGLP